MRVLHIIDSLNMGGAETWLVEMVKYAADKNTGLPTFDFLVAGGQKAIFDDTVMNLGSHIYYLKLDKHSTWSFIITRKNSFEQIPFLMICFLFVFLTTGNE